MTLQFRPKNNPAGPIYSPNRDLAYIYMPFMKEVIQRLLPDNMCPELKTFCEEKGVSPEDINEVLKAVLDAHHRFATEKPGSTLEDCLKNAKFEDTNFYAQLLFFYTMGFVITGGFFYALRDMTEQNTEPSEQTSFVSVLALCREMLDQRYEDKVPWIELEKTGEFKADSQYYWKERYLLANSFSEAGLWAQKALCEERRKCEELNTELISLQKKLEGSKGCWFGKLVKKFWDYVMFNDTK